MHFGLYLSNAILNKYPDAVCVIIITGCTKNKNFTKSFYNNQLFMRAYVCVYFNSSLHAHPNVYL